MEKIILWINENKEWLFSGIGVLIISNILSFFFGKKVGINITGNKIINNYNLTQNDKIALDCPIEISTGISGIEYHSIYDCLLIISAEQCELYIDGVLIKTLKKETFSYRIADKQTFKIIYSGKLPKLTLYPTKEEEQRVRLLYNK